MPAAVFWVLVNGREITRTLEPILLSIAITDNDGGESDTLVLTLDAADQNIEFPPTNAPIQAGIGWEDDAGGLTGPPVQFEGKVDTCSLGVARGQGRVLTINAKSADVKGKPKEHKEKHRDKGKLSEVAKAWGKDAGLEVSVADGIDIERPYWSMQGESFLNWAARTARECNATFKVRGNKAFFAERSAGKAIDGQPLPTITARYGLNIISGNMSPNDDRQAWRRFVTRYYDPDQAKYVYVNKEAREADDAGAEHKNRFDSADEATAKARGKSNSTEADRDQGGGEITIDGEPSAQAECPCEVIDYYPGIDGTYRIKTAVQKLDRSSGFTTSLTLKQPQGSAGKDSRGAGGE